MKRYVWTCKLVTYTRYLFCLTSGPHFNIILNLVVTCLSVRLVYTAVIMDPIGSPLLIYSSLSYMFIVDRHGIVRAVFALGKRLTELVLSRLCPTYGRGKGGHGHLFYCHFISQSKTFVQAWPEWRKEV